MSNTHICMQFFKKRFLILFTSNFIKNQYIKFTKKIENVYHPGINFINNIVYLYFQSIKTVDVLLIKMITHYTLEYTIRTISELQDYFFRQI